MFDILHEIEILLNLLFISFLYNLGKMKIILTSTAFIIGSIIGSFINVVIYRLPKSKSIVNPPSACPSCGNRLKWFDMIPILSYIFLKGRCRYCRAKISIIYPIVEILTALTFMFVYVKFGFSLYALKFIIFLTLIIAVSFIDLREGVVPDAIVIPGCGVAILFSLFEGKQIFLQSLLGLTFLGIIFLIIIILSRGGMGEGDITLGAMIGAFVGFKFSIVVFVLSFILGAIFGVIAILFLKKKGKDAIPFGPYLGIASFIVVFFGSKFIDLYYRLLW